MVTVKKVSPKAIVAVKKKSSMAAAPKTASRTAATGQAAPTVGKTRAPTAKKASAAAKKTPTTRRKPSTEKTAAVASAAPAKKAAPTKKTAAAKKTPRTRKPAAAKKATPAKKAAAVKKPAAVRKAAAPAKKAAATRKGPSAKVARPSTAAAPRRRGGAAPGQFEDFFDPGAQFDKLEPDLAPARRTTRGATRGATPVAAAVPGLSAGFFAAYTGEPLGEQAFELAAQALGCEVAAVKAVAEVESRGSGFDPQNRPTILYERHVFSRCTVPKCRFDGAHPEVSFRRPYAPGTYGNREQQWRKFAQAVQLDATAALKAPSWGMFQILGENHRACGYADVADFVRAMTTSQVEHLKAFVAFVRSHSRMLQAIRNRDWAGFARAYNGPAYATFKYDTKIAAAYARHGGRG